MKPSDDFPRMLFHRTKPPVTVHSREEEEALGAEWSRRLWPPPTAEPFPDLVPLDIKHTDEFTDEEDDEADEDPQPAPAAHHPPAHKPPKRPTKPAKKKR